MMNKPRNMSDPPAAAGPNSRAGLTARTLAAGLDSTPLDGSAMAATVTDSDGSNTSMDADGPDLRAQAVYHDAQLHLGPDTVAMVAEPSTAHGHKRKRRPSSLPSIDCLLAAFPPAPSSPPPASLTLGAGAHVHGHARTPPPTSALDGPAAATSAVALAAEAMQLESLSLDSTPSQPTSPLLTPLDPLSSLFTLPAPRSNPVTPISPTTPTPFRRARGGSSAPRPSSLLGKLDHLPMELLHLIAEYVATGASRGDTPDPMLVPRPHTQLAHLARACKRVCAAVLPVLYTTPAVESLAQLRRLCVSVQVAAVRALVLAARGACPLHRARWPVFAYVRGLDIARLEDGARGKREVATLVARVMRVARARTPDDVRQCVLAVGWAAVDPTLDKPECTCRSSLLGLTEPDATAQSPHSLRRVASNGRLAPAVPAPAVAGVYGMDLSSSLSTPPSPSTSPPSGSAHDYLPPPRLTHLNLSFTKSLTSTLLSSLLLPHAATLRLTHLNLSGTHLPDAQLAQLLSLSAHTLVRLSLAWNPHLSDLTLASLVPAAGSSPLRITHLDLTHCRDLSDWSLAKLAPQLPLLRALGLAWCPRVSGRVVHAALSYWPHLRALSVAGCPRVGGREAVARMWDGYVSADVELRARVGRIGRMVGAARGEGQVGLVHRCARLMVDEPTMGGCVYYLDV